MWARFLDLIYPSLCELCGSGLKEGESLCPSCIEGLSFIKEPFCKTCGETFEGNISSEFVCPNCHNISFAFTFARAALEARGYARELAHRFKYQRRFHLAHSFAHLLQEVMETDPRLNQLQTKELIVIPVPLHWWRRQTRTANQAYEIARAFSKLTGYPLLDALIRKRHTQTQTQLTRKERLKNLKGAFSLREKHREHLTHKTILLIDDVFTTGSTAHECASVLKKETQIKEIITLTLLRG